METMTLGSYPLQYILALVAGILILIMPRLLNYIVAIYLIVIGIMGLMAPSRRAAIIEKRKAYQEKLEAQLEEWNAQIALFISKAEKARNEGKFEYDKIIEVLQQKQGEMRIKLQELRSAGDEVWEELRAGVEQAWADLKIAFDKAASRFK
jgi:biopolymer transport protein ExbB/TolQ